MKIIDYAINWKTGDFRALIEFTREEMTGSRDEKITGVIFLTEAEVESLSQKGVIDNSRN